jgi:hypothetical protein
MKIDSRMEITTESLRKRRGTLKVFISFTTQAQNDKETAQWLKAKLRDAGFEAWLYSQDEGFGQSIRSSIRDQIGKCDFFCVVLSKSAAKAPYVQMELSLAVEYLEQKDNYSPRIFGVFLERDEVNVRVPLFDTANWKEHPNSWRFNKKSFDFSGIRNFSVDPAGNDSLDDLIDWMTPKIRFFGKDIKTTDELFENKAFDTYVKLFPDELERDSPHDICMWLQEQVQGEGAEPSKFFRRLSLRRLFSRRKSDRTWGLVLAVFELSSIAVGYCFLSVHRPSGMVFGDYFGLLESWRPYGRAGVFLNHIEAHLQEEFPNIKAIIFEVDAYESSAIEAITFKLEQKSIILNEGEVKLVLNEAEIKTIRALMRVNLYLGNNKSYILTNPVDKRPVSYRQPALSLPKDHDLISDQELPAWLASKEADMWLMVRPISKNQQQIYNLGEILYFVYIEAFGSFYEDILTRPKFSYENYLNSLKNKTLARNDLVVECSRDVPFGADKLWTELMRCGVSMKL